VCGWGERGARKRGHGMEACGWRADGTASEQGGVQVLMQQRGYGRGRAGNKGSVERAAG
jgi:hypothetical protein